MGFRTFAIGRGKDKEALARKLGAATISIPPLAILSRNCKNSAAPASYSPPRPIQKPCLC
jgi:hypothetical protein